MVPEQLRQFQYFSAAQSLGHSLQSSSQEYYQQPLLVHTERIIQEMGVWVRTIEEGRVPEAQSTDCLNVLGRLKGEVTEMRGEMERTVQ